MLAGQGSSRLIRSRDTDATYAASLAEAVWPREPLSQNRMFHFQSGISVPASLGDGSRFQVGTGAGLPISGVERERMHLWVRPPSAHRIARRNSDDAPIGRCRSASCHPESTRLRFRREMVAATGSSHRYRVPTCCGSLSFACGDACSISGQAEGACAGLLARRSLAGSDHCAPTMSLPCCPIQVYNQTIACPEDC